MQIRCASCGRAVTIAATGVLPERCPHCERAAVPARLGRWKIERLLAAGGMGEVYLAHHEDLRTRVAIKLLPPAAAADAAALRERFAREAVLTAAIDHPGVVRVIDFASDGDRAFLVLEYLDGRSLRSVLKDGPLDLPRALRIVTAVADVLAAAHAQGVVHRDVKPENVFLERDDRVRVLDFGIARALQDQEPITRTGEILGTPEYMAPEQLLELGDSIDARTDVHALGLLLHEMLTGKSPLAGANLFQTLKHVEALVPPPPSRLRAGVSPELDRLVQEATSKDREARPADAAAFAARLHALQPATPAAATPHAASRLRASGLVVGFLGVLLGYGLGELVKATRGTPEVPALADRRTRCDTLLAKPVLSARDVAALCALLPELRHEEAAPDEVARAGSVLLRLGAPCAALAELTVARERGAAGVAEAGALAFALSHEVLPELADVPAWLRAFDLRARARWLGGGLEDADAAPARPRLAGIAALFRGEPARAFALLCQDHQETRDENVATLALLAAHRACADRDHLAKVALRLRPANPGPLHRALAARVAATSGDPAALRALARELPPAVVDRPVLELLAEAHEARSQPRSGERLGNLAREAWLGGAGTLAPLWCVGLRVPLAATDAELARASALLAECDPEDHPAVLVLRAAFALAGWRYEGDPVAASKALAGTTAPELAAWRSLATATGSAGAEAGVARAVFELLLGRITTAEARLRALGEPTAASPSVRLVLDALDSAKPTLSLTKSTLANVDAALLTETLAWPLPRRIELAATLPECADVPGTTLLPWVRAALRSGASVAPDTHAGVHQHWAKEVQGGIQ